jgi:hypothetical protein
MTVVGGNAAPVAWAAVTDQAARESRDLDAEDRGAATDP